MTHVDYAVLERGEGVVFTTHNDDPSYPQYTTNCEQEALIAYLSDYAYVGDARTISRALIAVDDGRATLEIRFVSGLVRSYYVMPWAEVQAIREGATRAFLDEMAQGEGD